MAKNKLVVVTNILIEEEPRLSLEELCSVCQVTPEFIQDLIEYGIFEETLLTRNDFGAQHLRRVKTVLHLQKDLEVNLPGAALVLDLMDELEELRKQLEVFQKSVTRF